MHRRDFIAASVALAGLAGMPARALAEELGDLAFDPSIWFDDLAIVNANIMTLDPSHPRAEAVLVRRGRIAAVGSNSEVRAAAKGVRVVDARGRGLVPGFVDTHVHIEWTAAGLSLIENFFDEREPKSMAEVIARLRARAEKTPPGQWVVGEGNIAGAVAEQRMPTMKEMDSVSQSHFVVLSDMIHAHTANTLATKAMGYLTPEDEVQMRWSSTGEPMSGGVVVRDSHGQPLGTYDLIMRLPRDLWSVAELKGAIRKMARFNWTEGGVTSVSPMTMLGCNEYLADQELHAAGELPLRIRATYVVPAAASLDSLVQLGLARGYGNDMFRIGGVKVFLDGARAGGGPIVLSEGDKSSSNEALSAAATSRQIHAYTQDQFAAFMARAQAHGFPVQIHCLSEDGTILATAATEDLRRLEVGPQLHHRVEHWKPSLALAERMRAADLYFSLIATHPDIPPSWCQTPDTPYKSYIERGVKPVLVSDRCGGYRAPVRPLHTIARACISVDSGGEASAGNEIRFEDALRMWTLWAAESTHQTQDRGSIAVGKLGDFALLSENPEKMSGKDLFELNVAKTILGGEIVHEA